MTAQTRILLIGAGGHARSVWAALRSRDISIEGYTDRQAVPWLDAPWLGDDAALDALGPRSLCLGLGGVRPEALRRRLTLVDTLHAAGHALPTVSDASAVVGPDVETGAASQVLAGAVLQPGARLGRGCIVNSRAVVEHDAVIGDGAHVAPVAIVLGAARVGAGCMIGAGAVVLPGAEVPADTLVPSLTRWPR